MCASTVKKQSISGSGSYIHATIQHLVSMATVTSVTGYQTEATGSLRKLLGSSSLQVQHQKSAIYLRIKVPASLLSYLHHTRPPPVKGSGKSCVQVT